MRIDRIHGGLAGKILRVDLSSNKILIENTEDYAKRFIGGRAINSFILLNEMDAGTKWSDAENMLIFGVGCLAGTLTPGACRVSVDTKNAFNNGKGSANFGGHFGPELKYAGFDHVVITGRAKNPVYLWIHDGKAELIDASSIWGKTTDQTEEIIQRELGDNRVKVASIGPAGENMVRGSCIISDCAKAGAGSGVGCVMGSKKLKALAVRGHGSISVAEPGKFLDLVNTAFEKVQVAFDAGRIPRNLEERLDPENSFWQRRSDNVRNGQETYWPLEKRIRLQGRDSGVPKYEKKSTACFCCPVRCMPFLEIDEGKYKGTKGTGYWVNSVFYSQRFDVDDSAASLKYHLLANQLGLDGDNASVVLSWAFECYQKGLLTKEDTDGLELEWGNGDAMIKMAQKLAYRQGIGDFLADGVKEASRKLGKGSEQFAIHMKGQDSVDPGYRIEKGWGLGLSTSTVAGRHLRGAAIPSSSLRKIPSLRNLSSSPIEYKDQAETVFWTSQAKEIEDMAGVCSQPLGTLDSINVLGPSEIAELISAAMGIDLTEEELMRLGRRGYNLEKAFNTIHSDFSRKDDYPPKRYMEEPITSGIYCGHKCDKEEWDKMLNRYYALHGWDQETGLQTYKCLMELDMEDVVKKLDKAGKLMD